MRIGTLLTMALLLATASQAQAATIEEMLGLASAQYEQGDYEASGRTYDRAFELREVESTHYYNAACSWALAGNADKAFECLETAVGKGYREADWLVGDGDLAGLHDDPRWTRVVDDCLNAEAAYVASVNQELYEMFRADQSDRMGNIDWEQVATRDEARRRRAVEMIDAGLLTASDDFVHAAFIFQHGGDSTSYRTAHELAMTGVTLDSTNTDARWIAAASKDRYLLSIGVPQIYGTQFRLINDLWTMEPMDTTAVTDAERAWWGVPPLARQRARAETMN